MITIKRNFISILLFSTFILSSLTLLKYFYENVTLNNKENHQIASSENLKKTADSVVISKQAVDDLVKKAAQQKYIQDVFNDGKNLPMPKSQNITLQPYQSNTDLKSVSNIQTVPQNSALTRCSYNGQSYGAGDIVKTDQVWMRCTPTYYFSPDKPTLKQNGQPAWTAVQ